ncbi:MAG: hypothetical protein U5K81_10510 [Trueperaceae bacterium]|nr:hypothetical protein [Trueperaceae bacterium]
MRDAPSLPQSVATWIVVLVLVTAGIHFYRALVNDMTVLILFTLNAIGYLVLLAGMFRAPTQRTRRLARRVLIGYTAVTAILYVAYGLAGGGWKLPWGPTKEIAEIALLVLLFRVERAERTEVAQA